MDLLPESVCMLPNASACMPNGTPHAILLLLYGQLTFVDVTYTAEKHMVLGFGGGFCTGIQWPCLVQLRRVEIVGWQL